MELVNKHTKDRMQLTRLISQMAINQAYSEFKDEIANRENATPEDEFIFNLRAYNEEQVVGQVIDEIIAAGFHKIIVINDGSSDNTQQVLESKQKQYSDSLLIIASHTINRGGGAANQTGYNFVKKYGSQLQVKRFVGFDCDGQMDIKDMQAFMQRIHQHKVDLYVGSRFLK